MALGEIVEWGAGAKAGLGAVKGAGWNDRCWWLGGRPHARLRAETKSGGA